MCILFLCDTMTNTMINWYLYIDDYLYTARSLVPWAKDLHKNDTTIDNSHIYQLNQLYLNSRPCLKEISYQTYHRAYKCSI